MTLTIPVGVAHLDRGVPRSQSQCPLALAIRDFLQARDGIAWEIVAVSERGIYMRWDSQAVSSSYKHSVESLTFVTLFDSGQKIAAALLAGRANANGGFQLDAD